MNSSFNDTEIGQIASAWELKKLEDIAESLQYGITTSASKVGNIKFLRITDINGLRIDWESVPFCECPEQKLDKYRLHDGDIVFARIGATTGKSAIIVNPPNAVFASYLIRIRTKKFVDPCFLSHFFQSQDYWRQLDANKNANLKKGVNGSILRQIVIPIPTLPEQRKIAAVLSLLQRAIELQERLIALTTELKKALMHKLFTEGMRPGQPGQKMTEIGPLPESWEVVKIGDLGECFTGTTPRTAIAEYYEPGEYDFIAPADLGITKYVYSSEKKISRKGVEVARILPKDSIMCVCIGSSIGKTGMTWHEQSCTNQQINTVVCSNDVNSHYAYYLLSFWSNHWKNQATFGPVPILNKSAFMSVKISHTRNRIEQKNISEILSARDERIEFLMHKRDTFQSLFRTLLHLLMTGRIRVNNMELTKELL